MPYLFFFLHSFADRTKMDTSETATSLSSIELSMQKHKARNFYSTCPDAPCTVWKNVLALHFGKFSNFYMSFDDIGQCYGTKMVIFPFLAVVFLVHAWREIE